MARMKKMDKFVGIVEKILTGYGAKKTNEFLGYPWAMDTKAGRLFIKPDGEPSTVYSIFCRFQNPKDAKENGLESNPFTGKWNFHFAREKSCLYVFETGLREILKEKT